MYNQIRCALTFYFLFLSGFALSQGFVPDINSSLGELIVTDIEKISFDLKTKRARTFLCTFQSGDTIQYIISKSKKRNASLSILHISEGAVVDVTMDLNVIKGYFVANDPGVYNIIVRNRSLFANDFSLNIKKIRFIKKEEKPQMLPAPIKPILIKYDTLINQIMDSTLFLVSSLNLKNRPYTNIHFKTHGRELFLKLKSGEGSVKYMIYNTQGRVLKEGIVDSFEETFYIPADDYQLKILNEDKVVGKSVTIQLKEIFLEQVIQNSDH